MKQFNKYFARGHFLLAVGMLLVLPALALEAQEPLQQIDGNEHVNNSTFSTSLESSYVGASHFNFGGGGNSDAFSVNVGVETKIPLNHDWFVPLSMSSHNLWLGTVTGAPIPDHINTLGFSGGLGFRLNDQWTFVGSVGPQIYRLNDINSDDVGFAGRVTATYKWKANLTVVVGIGFETDGELPVVPVVGLRWDIQTNLTLNLMLPKPELIYRVNSDFDVFAGAGGNSAVFRADRDFGDKIGQPNFNNALGTYIDLRLGAGVEYKISHAVSLGIEGGYSVLRKIDYNRVDQTISFDPSPYVQVGLKWRF
jgi:opacity protein-like surface antigen